MFDKCVKIRKATVAVVLALMAAVSCPERACAQQFVSFAPARQFLEVDVHLLGGGSGVTQNYASCFPEIREINNSMGGSYGVGAGAVFGLNTFFGLGTELNILLNHGRTDMGVSNDDATSVSNVFLRNRYCYANIPVFMSFRFHVLGPIRWNVDAGLFYQYGLSGSQDQTIFNSVINDLGQLVPRVVKSKPDYFNSKDTFIHSYRRSDIGLHLSTALQFGRHFAIGARLQFGFKNVARTDGIVCPRIHNYDFHALAAYKF